jgi:hypothetical protein
MDVRDRFITALAEAVSEAYYAQGLLFLSIEQINAIARGQQVPDREARATLDLLDERGLLQRQEGGWAYGDGIGLLLLYEEANRRLYWQRNGLRREILRLAAIAYDEGTPYLDYEENGERFVDTPWAEAYAAAQTLEYRGLVEVQAFMGASFHLKITPSGRELERDARELGRELPVSAAEDDAAGADVAPDALQDLILNVEDLLAKRLLGGGRA